MKNILYILFIFLNVNAFSQVTVAHYNAEWNKANSVEWVDKLNDCDVAKIDIVKEPKMQQKHKIVVVPTIIIFFEGEEIKRYQADVSFTMKATREEVQEKIEEIIMENF